MNKLKLIKEKCIEANPEIVELKFGCILYRTNELRYYRLSTYNCFGGDKITAKLHSVRRHSNERQNNLGVDYSNNGGFYKDFKIIGRPITLSDVLLAMPVFDHNSVYDVVSHWNLKQNDLEKQDKPTINFLYELLK